MFATIQATKLWKQISYNAVINEIINKLISYIYLNMYKHMTDVKFLLLHINTWNNLTVSKEMIDSK